MHPVLFLVTSCLVSGHPTSCPVFLPMLIVCPTPIYILLHSYIYYFHLLVLGIYSHRLGTTSTVCRCGKVCKNSRGLKIHQTKMTCLRTQVVQCTEPVLVTTLGETEEELGPESSHSAQNLQAPQALLLSWLSEHRQVLWPSANKRVRVLPIRWRCGCSP